MENNRGYFSYLAVIASIFTVIGLLLGKYLYQDGDLVSFSANDGKVEEVISNVIDRYVDTVNQSEITDFAIKSMLSHLDPHSTYLPASKVPRETEQMQGNFVGIGIEYSLIDDSLMVVSPIIDGPSEKAGILGGDRLIGLNGREFRSEELRADSLSKLLRGSAGTELTIMIYRPSSKSKFSVNVIRKEIPIYSINAAFLLNDTTGFIKINRFAQKTPNEFKEATSLMIQKGANNIIIDVRGNPGGLLSSVESICNDFLSKGDTILSTKRQNDIDYKIADGSGDFKSIPVSILVDRNSASASEILAGTLQDNDRATIIGRRTFGKGLVQAVIPLQDKSRINLTIAKYHLPSGRCIQKPYIPDQLKAYKQEGQSRVKSGELYDETFINHEDSLKFFTKNGRPVFAESGITPDIFVPVDTTYITNLYMELIQQKIISDFAVKYYSPANIKGETEEECYASLDDTLLITKLKMYAEKKQIQWEPSEWNTSRPYLLNKLKSYIIRLKFRDNGFIKMSSSMDKDILEAINK